MNDAQRVLNLYKKCDEQKLYERALHTTKEKLTGFYERLEEFNQKREDNKKKLIEQMYIEPKPRINQSAVLSTNATVNNGLVTNNCANNKDVNNNKNKKVVKIDQDECTFEPKILPQSKVMRSKTADEMTYGPLVMKEIRVNEMKKGLEQREQAKCTFAPVIYETKKYAGQQSKLQLKENMSTYLKRVSLIQEKKATVAAIQRKEREYKEVIECTHQPKIREMPYYVKIKMESDREKNLREIRKEAYYSKIHAKNVS